MKTRRRHTLCLLWLVAGTLVLISGCGGRYLVATPNLLQHQDPQQVFAASATDSQSPDAQVIYATDRAIVANKNRNPTYGYGRSPNLVFGVADVSLNPHPSWQELIQDSTNSRRRREYELTLADVREMGRLRTHSGLALPGEPGASIVQAAAPDTGAQRKAMHDLIRNRLAQTAHKDVFLFIHGYNNTFDDAIFRAAEVWHFMGRVGVPVAYTWPAGLGGIRGYAYDRESGEFSVSHLREFIQAVADCPDVERVHLIAHSRGCDVTISALRELNLMHRAQGKSTQQDLKLENLVLAAPDVDADVFAQRFVAENLLSAARRTTIYASEHDKAIELTDLIFASRRRLGTLGVKDVTPKMRECLARLPNVQFIECKVSGWALTHSYVFTHPAALSDLILVLRDRRDPGEANGRPLRNPAEGVWELTDDYLARAK